MSNGTQPHDGRKLYQRAKVVLPVLGMILSTIVLGIALLMAGNCEGCGPTLTAIVPPYLYGIAGMTGLGSLGVAGHDMLRDRKVAYTRPDPGADRSA